MNERTHFFIKIYPLTALYSRKGWCWLCVRGELETGTDCYILTPQVLLTIAAVLSNSGWATQPWFTEGPGPLSGAGPHSADNCDWIWPKPSLAPGYIIVCGRTHLHRIKPRPQIKVIFRYLRPDAPISLLHRCISWLTARSRVNMLQN